MSARFPFTLRAWSVSTVAVVLVVTGARDACADTPSSSPSPSPDSLVQAAVALRREHKDAEALPLLESAYAASPSPRVRAQLGLTYRALERWVDAERALDHALAEPDDAWVAKNRSALEFGLASVRKHIGDLEVRANAEGAEVWVRGTKRGALPLAGPLRVDEGTSRVELRIGGETLTAATVNVVAERSQVVEFTVPLRPTLPKLGEPAKPDVTAPVLPLPATERPATVAAAPAPVHLATTTRDVNLHRRQLGIVVSATGLIGVGIGTVYGVLAASERSSLSDACRSGGACVGQDVFTSESAHAYANVSTGAFVLGGAVLAAGVTLVALSPVRRVGTVTAGVGPGSFVIRGDF